MKDYVILKSDGITWKVPPYDPVITEHFEKESSYIGSLQSDVNKNEIYATLFKGRRDLTFLDIGANIGFVSIYASPSCSRIVALEPDPSTFKVLEAMTYTFNIERVQCALSPSDDTVDFYRNDLNTTASSTVNTYGTKTTVRGATLSNILRENQLTHVDVCKIDAEGSEGESLSIDQLAYAQPIIREYWIEFHNCPKTSWEHKMGTTIGNLLRLGYFRMTIEGMTLWAKG